MNQKGINDSRRCEQLLQEASRPMTMKELARALNWPRKDKARLGALLEEMVFTGVLQVTDRGLYTPAAKGKMVQGTLMMTRRGTAYICGTDYENDLFVPRMKIGPGMHRDLVVARLEQFRGKLEASVLEVVDRGTHTFVGVVHRVGKGYWIEPRDERLPDRVRVVEGDASHGELVGAQFRTWNRGRDDTPTARIVKRIAKEGEAASETEMLIYDLGLPTHFPSSVIQEADTVTLDIDALLDGHHEDLRHLPFFTIDPESARDFDDAVNIEVLPDEQLRLRVAVADVGLFVRPGTLMDDEAFVRGTSVYLPDRVIPMLPERLSGDLCSIRPHVDRPAMVVELTVDSEGQCNDVVVKEAVIKSHCRLSYQAAAMHLEGEGNDELESNIRCQLERLQSVSRRLRKRRRLSGYLELELAEPTAILDAEGDVEAVRAYERNETHLMIEDAMLAANVAVANFCISNECETLYRIHGEPNQDKLEEFVNTASEFGVHDVNTSGVKLLTRSLDDVEDPDVKDLLSIQLLRAMMKAEYQTKLSGHYGLGFPAYLHFTSPIRRYPDLVVHRVVRSQLRKETLGMKRSLPEVAAQSNRRERLALDAERDVVAMYKCLWLKPRIQETFDGFVTHVSPKGAFIKLGNTNCDGFLPFSIAREPRSRRRHRASLVHDFYEEPSVLPLKVGDRVPVRLVDVNVTRRRVELSRHDTQDN